MKQIVIAAEANVFIGERDAAHTASVRLTNASVIRLWGTTHGLGEIALCGPTPKTILDPCGTVTLPLTAVIAILDCQ